MSNINEKRRAFLSQGLWLGAGVGSLAMGLSPLVKAQQHIKVGYLPIVDHLTLAVSHAQQKKPLKHFDVEPRMFKSWRSISGALKANRIQAGFLLSPLAMHIHAQGFSGKTVLVGHRNGSSIAVRKGAGINSAAALNGKKIAVPAKVSTHTMLLDQYLRSGGLSLRDVQTSVVAPSHMLKALKRGNIDGFIVAEPFGVKAEQMGIGEILTLSNEIMQNHICCTLMVRNELLEQSPEGVEEWVASLMRAGQFIHEDKTDNQAIKTAELVSNYMPHTPKEIQLAINSPHDRTVYTGLSPQRADYERILTASKQAGMFTEAVDLDNFIDGRFAG